MSGLVFNSNRSSETQINAQSGIAADVTGSQITPVGIVYGNTSSVFYVSAADGSLHGTFVNTATGIPSGNDIVPAGIGSSALNNTDPQIAHLFNGGDTTIPSDLSMLVWTSSSKTNANVSTIQGELFTANGEATSTAVGAATPFLIPTTGLAPSHAHVAGFQNAKSVVAYQSTIGGVPSVSFDILGSNQKVVVPSVTVGSGTAPVVATLNDPNTSANNQNFVVAWVGTDASGSGIHAQIYNQSGVKVGGELGGTGGALNEITQGNQNQVAIAALSNGNFVVTWTDASTRGGPSEPASSADTSSTAIKARVFDKNGSAVGDEFTVNTDTNDAQTQPSVTAGPNGGFVIGWTDNSQQADASGNVDVQGTAIKAQAFDATGAKIGGELLVNTDVRAGSQSSVNLTTAPDGSILAVFQDGSNAVKKGSTQTPDPSFDGIQSVSLTVDTGASSGAGATPPTVAFGATAKFTSPTEAVLSGTYAATAGSNTTINVYEKGVLLGAATVATDGTWKLPYTFKPGDHGFFTAQAVDPSQPNNPSQIASANYGLTTGNAAGTRKAEVDSYTSSGDYTGYTKYNKNGTVNETLAATTNSAGNFVNNYTGGTAVRALGLTSYVDVLSHRTGDLVSTTQNVITGGSHDLFAKDGADTFVFQKKFGQDTVQDFLAQGTGHDVLSFKTGEFSSLANILQNTSQQGADTVISAANGDTVTLKNVVASSLQTSDFKLHA